MKIYFLLVRFLKLLAKLISSTLAFTAMYVGVVVIYFKVIYYNPEETSYLSIQDLDLNGDKKPESKSCLPTYPMEPLNVRVLKSIA